MDEAEKPDVGEAGDRAAKGAGESTVTRDPQVRLAVLPEDFDEGEDALEPLEPPDEEEVRAVRRSGLDAAPRRRP